MNGSHVMCNCRHRTLEEPEYDPLNQVYLLSRWNSINGSRPLPNCQLVDVARNVRLGGIIPDGWGDYGRAFLITRGAPDVSQVEATCSTAGLLRTVYAPHHIGQSELLSIIGSVVMCLAFCRPHILPATIQWLRSFGDGGTLCLPDVQAGGDIVSAKSQIAAVPRLERISMSM